MIMGNLKKRHSDKNILSSKYHRTSSKGSLMNMNKGTQYKESNSKIQTRRR